MSFSASRQIILLRKLRHKPQVSEVFHCSSIGIDAYCNDTLTRPPSRLHGGCSGNLPRRRPLVSFNRKEMWLLTWTSWYRIGSTRDSRIPSFSFFYVSLTGQICNGVYIWTEARISSLFFSNSFPSLAPTKDGIFSAKRSTPEASNSRGSYIAT